SAHPMLQPEEGAQLLLPEECRAASVAASASGRLGGYGDQITWPHWTDARGVRHDLSRVRSPRAQDLDVYYFLRPLAHGFCGLRYPSIGRTLRLTFPAAEVPFLGVLVGEGQRTDPRFFVLLEPCSVPFARLDNALP